MWIVHHKPLQGEALTSWLVRIARARGVTLHFLIGEISPGLQFWNRDGDLIAPDPLLAALADGTGTTIKRAREATLPSLEGVIDERICGDHQSPMVAPLGVFHRTRRAHGQQFCPMCLIEAPAYYRLWWRLKLFPVCTRHGLILGDACPNCDAPVVPPRGGFTACHLCGQDLRDARLREAHPRVLALQFHNERVLGGHAVTWPFLQGEHPLSWFQLLLFLVRAVASGKRGEPLRACLAANDRAISLAFRSGSSHVRGLTSESIHDCLAGVDLLLRGWPAMFAGICQDAGFWGAWVSPDGKRSPPPMVLRTAIDTYLRPGSA